VSLRGIILLLWFIPSIPMCFFRPFYGIVVWTIIAFTSPQWYTWGAASLLPWAVLAAIPTMAGFVVYCGKNWGRFSSREGFFICLLWGWFAVTTIVALNVPLFQHHRDDTISEFSYVSKVFLMFFLTIGIVDTFSRLRTLVVVIASCFGIFILKSAPFLIRTGGSDRIYGPQMSMIADNNDFGLALNMTLPFFFFLAQTESDKRLKRLWQLLFVLTIPTILFTYSRGALLGLVVILTLMILRLKQRLVLIPVAIAAVVVMSYVAPETWKQRMNPSSDNVMDKSAQGRINAWKFAINLIGDYPITGGGFGTFTRPLFLLYAPDPADFHGPHSVYFSLLGEHGIVGLLLFLTLIASCFYSLYVIIKWAKFHGDEVALSFAHMFRFSLVGFLTSGFFLGRAYFDYLYTIIACIVVLQKVCFDTWRAETHEEEDEGEDGDVQHAQVGFAG
jgi:probable O-glycosylation ligase (exosortase A-associated)